MAIWTVIETNIGQINTSSTDMHGYSETDSLQYTLCDSEI